MGVIQSRNVGEQVKPTDGTTDKNEEEPKLSVNDLNITWAEEEENGRYWRLHKRDGVDVAELVHVWWLEIHGKFDTSRLARGKTYRVYFQIMLKDSAVGWELPVNLKLSFPNNTNKPLQRRQNFKNLEREKWIDVLVGEFVASRDIKGEIDICLIQNECGQMKTGLIVKGVKIERITDDSADDQSAG